MTAVGESDSTLATKCLDLCQTLADQGLAFNFSLKIGSTFSFSLGARDKGLASEIPGKTKKKPSPSTLRRNARRKEAFLKKRQTPVPVSPEACVEPGVGLPQQGEDGFNCDICGNTFKSDNGLRIHKGKSHKSQELPSIDRIRDPDIVQSRQVSPLKDVREEVPNPEPEVHSCDECGEQFDTEDDLDIHTEIHGDGVRCFHCLKDCFDCYNSSTTACPRCFTPWPHWQFHLASLS